MTHIPNAVRTHTTGWGHEKRSSWRRTSHALSDSTAATSGHLAHTRGRVAVTCCVPHDVSTSCTSVWSLSLPHASSAVLYATTLSLHVHATLLPMHFHAASARLSTKKPSPARHNVGESDQCATQRECQRRTRARAWIQARDGHVHVSSLPPSSSFPSSLQASSNVSS